MNWLSYGGGVNSTALAVLLCEGELKKYEPWEAVFADTLTEKNGTYEYVDRVFIPYLLGHGRFLNVVQPVEGVLERWERLKVTGSRILRVCTDKGKIEPIEKFLKARAVPGDVQLIGIDAGESHRAKAPRPRDKWGKAYPLVEKDIDREDCIKIIRAAGLSVPPKSGCWCCPFMRVGEVMDLALESPGRFDRIVRLEEAATVAHGPGPEGFRAQWGDRPAKYWKGRAGDRAAQGNLFGGEVPCGCYDG